MNPHGIDGPAPGRRGQDRDHGPVDGHRERAELLESASLANLAGGVGLAALILVPLAWVMAKLRRATTRT